MSLTEKDMDYISQLREQNRVLREAVSKIEREAQCEDGRIYEYITSIAKSALAATSQEGHGNG